MTTPSIGVERGLQNTTVDHADIRGFGPQDFTASWNCPLSSVVGRPMRAPGSQEAHCRISETGCPTDFCLPARNTRDDVRCRPVGRSARICRHLCAQVGEFRLGSQSHLCGSEPPGNLGSVRRDHESAPLPIAAVRVMHGSCRLFTGHGRSPGASFGFTENRTGRLTCPTRRPISQVFLRISANRHARLACILHEFR